MNRTRTYNIAHNSYTGLVRENNEDCHVVFGWCSETGWEELEVGGLIVKPTASLVLVGIADGMGGVHHGQVASSTVIEGFSLALSKMNPELQIDWPEVLVRLFVKLNVQILSLTEKNPELAGMGSTFTVGVIRDNIVDIVWSGDSRVYQKLLEENDQQEYKELLLHTRDHTVAWEFVDGGHIDLSEVDNHPKSHVLTQCVGVREDAFKPETTSITIEPGSRLLFCSDGVNGNISKDEIDRLLSKPYQPNEIVKEIKNSVYEYGATDNVTICIVDYGVIYKKTFWQRVFNHANK